MIELSLPAGKLENAIYAFLGGADSVYFGLKEFSARKGAGNFSISDFRKIRRYAKERNKKIYITINTLIKDSELENVFSLLKEIEKYGCDGIIVQDLGVIRILRNYFPDLRIHASTQLAVHTDCGVRMMKDLGAERVVLSRELSLKEIEGIRRKNRDIELKVFIHGAMCYGFSGLCMASLYKTGRSANRGECAQICRTWFNYGNEKLYPFSMRDMDAGERIRELERIGIDSVKVEGRMKGDEYDYFTAKYYRSLLDGTHEEDKHAYTFLREHSDGYFEYSGANHKDLITDNYTAHAGKVIGSVISQNGKRVKVRLNEEIKDRDGLMFLRGTDAYKFSARLAKNDELILSEEIKLSYGTPLYKISDASMNLKKINTDSLKEEKEIIRAEVIISDGILTVKTENLERRYDVTTMKAEKNQDQNMIKALEQSQEDVGLGIVLQNSEKLFIPAKELKERRREFISELISSPRPEKTYIMPSGTDEGIALPERSLLSGEIYPWNEEGVLIDGVTYITLPAVTYEEERKYSNLLKKAESITTPLLIGLNNIADVYFAMHHPQYKYFMDIYLYASNIESVALIKDLLKESLAGAYAPADFDEGKTGYPVKVTKLNGYRLPIFISRSCFRHDSLKEDCQGCSRHHEYAIEQNGKRLNVIVDKCNTVVKEEPSR